MNIKERFSILFYLTLVVGFSSCNTLATYDQVSYQNATNAKVDTLALMSNAKDSYSSHTKDIATLNLQLDKAYEYDKGRPLDAITVGMWDKLRIDVNKFILLWKKKGTLNEATIDDFKTGGSGTTGISSDFDQIIELESGKNKSPQSKSQ